MPLKSYKIHVKSPSNSAKSPLPPPWSSISPAVQGHRRGRGVAVDRSSALLPLAPDAPEGERLRLPTSQVSLVKTARRRRWNSGCLAIAVIYIIYIYMCVTICIYIYNRLYIYNGLDQPWWRRELWTLSTFNWEREKNNITYSTFVTRIQLNIWRICMPIMSVDHWPVLAVSGMVWQESH